MCVIQINRLKTTCHIVDFKWIKIYKINPLQYFSSLILINTPALEPRFSLQFHVCSNINTFTTSGVTRV